LTASKLRNHFEVEEKNKGHTKLLSYVLWSNALKNPHSQRMKNVLINEL
jgi:hypothetical protein